MNIRRCVDVLFLHIVLRCVSESMPPARSAPVEPQEVLETAQSLGKTESSPKPQPRSSVKPPLPNPSSSGAQAEVRLAGPASPIMAHRAKSSPATVIQSSHHHPSPPLTPTHGRDSPTVAKVFPMKHMMLGLDITAHLCAHLDSSK